MSCVNMIEISYPLGNSESKFLYEVSVFHTLFSSLSRMIVLVDCWSVVKTEVYSGYKLRHLYNLPPKDLTESSLMVF